MVIHKTETSQLQYRMMGIRTTPHGAATDGVWRTKASLGVCSASNWGFGVLATRKELRGKVYYDPESLEGAKFDWLVLSSRGSRMLHPVPALP